MQERRKNADEGDRSDGRLVLLTSFILSVFGGLSANLEGEGIRGNVIANMGGSPFPSFCHFVLLPVQPSLTRTQPDK